MPKSFANFGNAQLHDKRRTNRLVQSRSDGLETWWNTATKVTFACGFEGSLSSDEIVTHKAILEAHHGATFDKIKTVDGPVLVLHDTTELEYTKRKSLKAIGQIGNGNRRGYLAHNSLAIEPESRNVLGLCNQLLHCRPKVKMNETAAQKRKRSSRESRLWVRGTQPLPSSWQLVDVCDQEPTRRSFYVMNVKAVDDSSFEDRRVLVGHGDRDQCEATKLRDAQTLVQAGSWTLQVAQSLLRSPRRKGKKKLVKRVKREANMAVSFAPVQLDPSTARRSDKPMKIWIAVGNRSAERARTFGVDVTDESSDQDIRGCLSSGWLVRMSLDNRRVSQRDEDGLPHRGLAIHERRSAQTGDRFTFGCDVDAA